MQLQHAFTVPVPVDEAFRVLRDVQRIAPCMPGATVEEVEGDRFTGRVKVKLGPVQVTYRGEAEFTEIDEAAHSTTLVARGKESRGAGTAQATVRAQLEERGTETHVVVTTDLAITGRPAQFGRGVMADVGEKLIGQFAACLADELAGGAARAAEPAGEPAAAAAAAARGAVPAPPPASDATAIPEPVASTEPVDGAPPMPEPPDAVTPVTEDSPAPAPAATVTAAASHGESTIRSLPPRPTDDAIDLLDVAGGPVAKRLVPVAGLVALLLLVIWLIRRRD